MTIEAKIAELKRQLSKTELVAYIDKEGVMSYSDEIPKAAALLIEVIGLEKRHGNYYEDYNDGYASGHNALIDTIRAMVEEGL